MPRKPTLGKRLSQQDVEIGLRLRLVRVSKGISQMSLAEQIGVTFQQVQKYETGTNRIALTRAQQISQILGISLEGLTGHKAAPLAGDGVQFDTMSIKLLMRFERLPNRLKPHFLNLMSAIELSEGQ